MRFTQQDFEGALDFVRDLYDQRGLADYADRAMSALLRIVGADRVVYGDFDVERQLARLSMQPAIVKEADGTVNGVVNGAISVLERDFGQHPLYRYFLQTGDGRPQKMTAVMTRTQYRHYCERDEFAGQLGARFQMGLFFAAGPTVVTAIVATRTQRDFSERERALMSRLYPHLVQAFRNTASAQGRTPHGEVPAKAIGKTIETTVRIDSVNAAADTVTFTRPDGISRTMTVENPDARKFVERLNPGDQVAISYREAAAVSIQPARR